MNVPSLPRLNSPLEIVDYFYVEILATGHGLLFSYATDSCRSCISSLEIERGLKRLVFSFPYSLTHAINSLLAWSTIFITLAFSGTFYLYSAACRSKLVSKLLLDKGVFDLGSFVIILYSF